MAQIHDYVACCVPFGLFFGRLANFINQELWGAQTTVPWAVRFVEATPSATSSVRRVTRASSTKRSSRASCFSGSSGGCSGKRTLVTSRASSSARSSSSTACSVSASSSFGSRTASSSSFAQATAPAHGSVAVAADDPRRPLPDADREAATCPRRADGGHLFRRVTPLERALRERISRRGADHHRNVHGSLQRLLLRNARPVRRGGRLHHCAGNQPDVRRDGRGLPRRCVGACRGAVRSGLR